MKNIIDYLANIINGFSIRGQSPSDALLIRMLDKAKELGAGDYIIKYAEEYLEYNEDQLFFETLVTLIYEDEVIIDKEFFNLTCKVGKLLEIPEENYIFIKELIK
jgi:hypothetical protein